MIKKMKIIVHLIILFNFIVINSQPINKGFVGYSEVGKATYTSNFYDAEASNQTIGIGAEGKTTAEMKTDATYTDAGWDFTNIWMISRDFFSADYPTFRETEVGVAEENKSGLPAEYSLSQNYPNPFNPSTIISFTLPQQSNIKLLVYNSIGEQVAMLINSNMSSGIHKVNFNAANLSSGLYFYKISAGSFVDVKKMLLIK